MSPIQAVNSMLHRYQTLVCRSSGTERLLWAPWLRAAVPMWLHQDLKDPAYNQIGGSARLHMFRCM